LLLRTIADVVADYRQGEVEPRTPAHVDRWVRQFSPAAQEVILEEMAHVLPRLYISQHDCVRYLDKLVSGTGTCRVSRGSYWRSVNFLHIQQKGESQKVMLGLLDTVLREAAGVRIADCGSVRGPYVYLDDCIFTATHVRWDLINWVKTKAPQAAQVFVVSLAQHKGRLDYTTNKVTQEAWASGKDIKIMHWRSYRALVDEDGPGAETEVLLPRSFPTADPHVKTLVDSLTALGHPPRPRQGLTTPANGTFSSEERRHTIEQEFLKAGARIKYQLCTNLKTNHWPLGYDVFKSPGFGSLLVTYRNCPNNCPLALWAGPPWVPLFPRKNNLPEQNWASSPAKASPAWEEEEEHDGATGDPLDDEIPF
jgi:hypothetical protein